MFWTEGRVPTLEDGEVALTYDDGPGPNTIRIAEYLGARGIRATFFVVGKHVRQSRDVVRKVMGLGHSIGNHTDTHLDLTELVSQPERLSEEVLRCSREVQACLGVCPFPFRAPGGAWNSQVAGLLNRNPEFREYFGPFGWDVDCADFDVGRPSPNHQPDGSVYTLERCQEKYLRAIQSRHSAVVLLHDWCANEGDEGDALRQNNRTFALTEWLILQLNNFRFVQLSEKLA